MSRSDVDGRGARAVGDERHLAHQVTATDLGELDLVAVVVGCHDPQAAGGDEVQAVGRIALVDEHGPAGHRDRLERGAELRSRVRVHRAEDPVLLDEPVELAGWTCAGHCGWAATWTRGLRGPELAGQPDEQLLGQLGELPEQGAEHPDPEHRDLDVGRRDHGRAPGRAVEDRQLAEVRAGPDPPDLVPVARITRLRLR